MSNSVSKKPTKPSTDLVQLTSWSYSRYVDYDTCPLKAKLKHIDRLREPDNQHTERGTIVHKLGEQYVRGQLTKFPLELNKKFEPKFKQLRALKALVEQEWAFDEHGNLVAWFAKNVRLRVKMDAHHVTEDRTKVRGRIVNVANCTTVDYKTGKQKSEHAQQRSLYAVAAFLVYPDVQVVHAEHWYIDSGEIAVDTFKRSDLDRLISQWEMRTRAMLNDRRFAPRPGSYCRYCHFRKDNGGSCQF